MSDPNTMMSKTKTSKGSADMSMSLEEYEKKKKKRLQSLKKTKLEDERMLREMSVQNDIAIVSKSKTLNANNPLATNGAKQYEQNRHRLMMKYVMQ